MGPALRIAIATLTATAVAAIGLVGTTAGAAPTRQVKVCVNKKTGEAMQLRKGKCRKGWKRISWSSEGPTGAPGVPGAGGERGSAGGLSLYANGQRVGRLIGGVSAEIFAPTVVVDGGMYTYFPDGSLASTTESPSFLAADCSGTAYFVSPDEEDARIIASWAGTSVRLVARTLSPSLGAIQGVWVPSGEVTALPGGGTNMWRRTDDGTCVGPSLQTGWSSTLTSVTPPANLTPPLTVR